jgi:prevent-host-death family protein
MALQKTKKSFGVGLMLEFLQKNTITVDDLKSNAGKIIAKTKRSGQPILITQNGKPTAILLNAKEFLDDLAAENLARQIAIGEADIAAGRLQDLDEALEEIRRARNVSRPRHHRRKS